MSECNHINQVLANQNSRDGILKAFNATKYIIHHSLSVKKLLHAMRCEECHEINSGSNYMCLQCGFCGCWNGKHFESHNKKVGHVFGVNSSNGLLYCFKCNDYVGDSELINASLIGKFWDEVCAKTSVPAMENRDGLTGYFNMGSTCYMSCIMQCLLRNPYFLKYSLNQTHHKECKLNDPTTCISCTLDLMVKQLYAAQQESGKDTQNNGLIGLLACAWQSNENLAGYSQQDAHEFWQFLMNRLHHEYKTNKDVTDGDNNIQSCGCIYHKVFQGFLKSTINCSKCGNESKITEEPFMDLSLNIKGKQSLIDCLNSFHKKEKLQGFNFFCNTCNESTDAARQLTVFKLSPVMLFQLKRFEHLGNGKSKKLNDFVSFPLYLNMKDYCSADDQPPAPDVIYELLGIICHTGTVDEGHYTAICKISNGQWIKFNDSMVTVISEEKILQEQAYLMIYSVKHVS